MTTEVKHIFRRLGVCGVLVAAGLAAGLPGSANAQVPETYPRTFTDAGGRSVTLESPPARIASVVLGVDENLLDLVDPSRIAVMTELSRNPAISNVADRTPADKAIIRDRWQPVVDAEPDLVLVASYTAGLAAPLIERGLPVYEFSDFSSVDSLLDNLVTLGRLVGAEERAQAIVRERRAELRAARRKAWRRPLRALYYSEGFLFTGGTVAAEIIGHAGLDDAAADFGLVGVVTATPALMDNLDPDVVLVGEDSEAIAAETLAAFERPEFQVVDAIRAGRVYTLPSRHATTVSHHVVSAVADIQALPLD